MDVSNLFFQCYSDESLKPESLLSINPQESLSKCQKKLRAYETCMKNDKNVKIPQQYRVCFPLICLDGIIHIYN